MEQKPNLYTTYLIPILAWMLLFFYLIFTPKIMAYSIEEDGLPIESNIAITDIALRKEYRYRIDGITKQSDNPKIYRIFGWAFVTTRPEEPTDLFETKIVLFTKSKNYVYITNPSARPGVQEAFKDLGLNIMNPGFSGYINKYALNYGKYCIGIKLTNQVDNTSLFILTNRIAKVTPIMYDISMDIDEDQICNDIINNYIEKTNKK